MEPPPADSAPAEAEAGGRRQPPLPRAAPSPLTRRIVFRRGLTETAPSAPRRAVYLNPGHGSANGHAAAAVPAAAEYAPAQGAEALEDPTYPPHGTELYEESKADQHMTWKSTSLPASRGIRNIGNSCFMASTLQCFTHTAPLVNWLEQYKGPRQKGTGVDWVRMLANHTRAAFDRNNRSAFPPSEFFQQLRRLNKKFRPGRQEDAQEFASYLLEACQSWLLQNVYGGKHDPLVAETTPLRRIFGGFLRSRVQWTRKDEEEALRVQRLKARKRPQPQQQQQQQQQQQAPPQPSAKPVSDTFDPFTFLNLEINGDSLERSLQHFTAAEKLDRNNLYKTPSGAYVQAVKRFTIHRPPRVLVVHLKRFMTTFTGRQCKIRKRVSFPTDLDLRAHLSRAQKPCTYKLFAVLVHEGSSMHSGHYVAYAKGSNGIWMMFNDSHVSQVSVDQVLRCEAYLLFYQRHGPWALPQSPAHAPHSEGRLLRPPSNRPPAAPLNCAEEGYEAAPPPALAAPGAVHESKRQRRRERLRAAAEQASRRATVGSARDSIASTLADSERASFGDSCRGSLGTAASSPTAPAAPPAPAPAPTPPAPAAAAPAASAEAAGAPSPARDTAARKRRRCVLVPCQESCAASQCPPQAGRPPPTPAQEHRQQQPPPTPQTARQNGRQGHASRLPPRGQDPPLRAQAGSPARKRGRYQSAELNQSAAGAFEKPANIAEYWREQRAQDAAQRRACGSDSDSDGGPGSVPDFAGALRQPRSRTLHRSAPSPADTPTSPAPPAAAPAAPPSVRAAASTNGLGSAVDWDEADGGGPGAPPRKVPRSARPEQQEQEAASDKAVGHLLASAEERVHTWADYSASGVEQRRAHAAALAAGVAHGGAQERVRHRELDAVLDAGRKRKLRVRREVPLGGGVHAFQRAHEKKVATEQAVRARLAEEGAPPPKMGKDQPLSERAQRKRARQRHEQEYFH